MSGNNPDRLPVEGTIRWALVGASTIARTYMAHAIRNAAGGELVGVVSGDQKRATALANEVGLEKAYCSHDELWADNSIDAVYISSVNSRHAEDVRAAAGAGKHVLCDKPLATSIADSRALIRACEKAEVVLGVNHNLRCAPAHALVQRLIEDDAIGRVLAARVFHGALLPSHQMRWRTRDAAAGGGVALDITVHDIDLLRFLLRDEVTEVSAFADAQSETTREVEDAIAGVLRFRGGALATFQDSFSMPFARTILSVHGESGWIEVRDAMADDPVASVWLTDESGSREVHTGEPNNLYEGVVTAFNDAVRGIGPVAASGEDGLRAVAVALGARKAAEIRKTLSIATFIEQEIGECLETSAP